MFRKDNIFFGLIPGLVLPLLVALYLYKLWALGSYKQFYSSVNSGNLTKLLALGCLLNLGMFFLFLKFDKYKAARGVIMGTMFYVLVTVYYMFA